MKKRNFVVLGGDRRNLELVNLLELDGHNVRNLVESDKKTLEFKDSEIVIGPLPFSQDNETLDAPFYNSKLIIDEVFNSMKKDQYFIAGNIHKEHMEKAQKFGINIIDYFKREEMQVLNAIPTAEGAIQVAMENLSTTLHSSNVMVLGYGRIGKTLSNLLYNMGANTNVIARDYGHIAWIENAKLNPIFHKDLNKYLPKMDVIFNTIPNLILTEEKLNHMKKETLIIDLASKPGGVDFDAAKDLGIKAIHALGLPGKYAPVSAAKIIKDTIYNVIDEGGI